MNKPDEGQAAVAALNFLSLMDPNAACDLIRMWQELGERHGSVRWQILHADPAQVVGISQDELDQYFEGESRALIELTTPHHRLVHLGHWEFSGTAP